MKGLVKKDYYILLNYRRNILIMLAMAVVLAFFQSMTYAFIPGFIMFISCTYLIGLFSYDEYAGWERYQAALPLGTAAVVHARYLAAYGLLGVMGLGAFVVTLAVMPLKAMRPGADAADPASLALTTLILFLLCALILLVLLPLCYKLGPEKVRYALIAVYAAIMGLLVALLLIFRDPLADFSVRFGAMGTLGLGLGAALVVIGVLVVLSYRLSLGIYSKKEF